MTIEREVRTPLLGATVIALAGGLLALAALAVVSPALLVGLIPGWFADLGSARLTRRVGGGLAIVLVIPGIAAIGYLVHRRLGDLQRPAASTIGL